MAATPVTSPPKIMPSCSPTLTEFTWPSRTSSTSEVMTTRSLKPWLSPTGALWLLLLTGSGMACSRDIEYRRFDSPDGAYHVTVYRRSSALSSSMPGQSGDAPGKVRLHDKSGRVLREAEVDMVQLVDQVEWDARGVHIKLVADWPLGG